MHHFHASTNALFVVGLFTLGILALIFALIRSVKKDRLAAEQRHRTYEAAARELYPQHDATSNTGRPYVSYGAAAPSAPVHLYPNLSPAPAYYAPGYMGMDPGSRSR